MADIQAVVVEARPDCSADADGTPELINTAATKYDFRRHLRILGFEVVEPGEPIRAKLRDRFGADRCLQYSQFQRRALARGAEGQNAIYESHSGARLIALLRAQTFPPVEGGRGYRRVGPPVRHDAIAIEQHACWYCVSCALSAFSEFVPCGPASIRERQR